MSQNRRKMAKMAKSLTGMAQEYPTVDSGPHPGVHQQRRLALKEPGPESFRLFGVIHLREQTLSNFS